MRRSFLMLACVVAVGACGSDDNAASGPGNAAGSPSDAPLSAAEQCPAGTPDFTIGASGLTARDAATNVAVRIDNAPKPPERSFNTWKIVVTDASGAPLPAAQLTWACAWMAVHGHGTNPKSVEKLGDGVFSLEKQNFSMYGPWQVQLWIDPTGKAPAYAPQSVSGVENGNACTPSNGASRDPNIRFDFCVPRTND